VKGADGRDSRPLRAVGYSLKPFSPGWVKPVDVYGAGSFQYDSIFWTARTPLLILAFAVAVAILVRQAQPTG
jgi:hypothetical protein